MVKTPCITGNASNMLSRHSPIAETGFFVNQEQHSSCGSVHQLVIIAEREPPVALFSILETLGFRKNYHYLTTRSAKTQSMKSIHFDSKIVVSRTTKMLWPNERACENAPLCPIFIEKRFTWHCLFWLWVAKLTESDQDLRKF